MQTPPPNIDQSLPSFRRYIRRVIGSRRMFDAVFASFVFGYLGDVGFVSRGIFTVEDLTTALMDATCLGR